MNTPARFLLLTALLVIAVAGCTSEATREAAQDASQALQTYLEHREQQTGFSGVVLVEQHGRTLLRAGYGLADSELQIPNTPEYIFRIGSLTKPVTATGVLMLHQQGLLQLSDSVCDYVARCPDAWKTVSIHHLLNHTSGIPDLFGALDEAPVLKTRAEMDRVIGERGEIPLQSVPGATYAYSNFNYMLLGYIIEGATGHPWEEILIEKIFTPLAMARTRYDDVWAVVEGRVHGYQLRDGALANITYDDHSAYAAGGLRSTVDDLSTWHKAYVGGRLISPALLEAALQAYAGPYGYGWQVLALFDRPMHNHTGGIDGFSAHLAYYPGDQVLIIVLSNVEDENTKGTACDLAALLFEAKPFPETTQAWVQQPNTVRCHQTPEE